MGLFLPPSAGGSLWRCRNDPERSGSKQKIPTTATKKTPKPTPQKKKTKTNTTKKKPRNLSWKDAISDLRIKTSCAEKTVQGRKIRTFCWGRGGCSPDADHEAPLTGRWVVWVLVLVVNTNLLILGGLRDEGGDGTSSAGPSCCPEPVREQRGFCSAGGGKKHAPLRSSAGSWAGKLGGSSARFTGAIKLLEKLQNWRKVIIVWFGVYINRLEKVIA